MTWLTLYYNAYRFSDDGNYDYSDEVLAVTFRSWVLNAGLVKRAKIDGDLVFIMTETHVFKIVLNEYRDKLQDKIINLLYPLL